MLENKQFVTGQFNWLALATLLWVSPSASAETEAAQQLPEMTVQGETPDSPDIFPIELQQAPLTTADTAALLERAPGANVNRNGPLTGLAQYRGMYGDRINVLVNGIHLNTGGPNGMDPPLSYIPRAQLESLEVIRGIAPVSTGLETIGGTMKATARTSHFGSGDNFIPSADVSLGGATVDSSYTLGAFGATGQQEPPHACLWIEGKRR